MGWAQRVGEGPGRNQKVLMSTAGAVIGDGRLKASDDTRYIVTRAGSVRRSPKKLRGKANVKAAKRARTYDAGGHRVIQIAA